MSAIRDKGVTFTESSGNVFADLGLPSSPGDMLKIRLAQAIGRAIQRSGLTQVQAAKILGTDQAKVSAIMRGRLKNFGVDRLINFLIMLGHDVDVRINPRAKNSEGKLKITG